MLLAGQKIYKGRNKEGRHFIRDGRAPIPMKVSVSRSMSSNKGKNTGPEIVLRKAISNSGIKGYRLHRKIPGSPDISFGSSKLAVFVNGCFWHSCPYCKPTKPKSNRKFWSDKFTANRKRDISVKRKLRALGWRSITIWECQIKKDIDKCVSRIKVKIGDSAKK